MFREVDNYCYTSYKLVDIYERIHKHNPVNAGTADGFALALMSCFSTYNKYFLEMVHRHVEYSNY